MDEEQLKKRFTDCVYFLASPLTCKKGIECEYRHSEIARLNPRDCWYWLGECCFNPDCAFRHPPLEGIKEAYFEPFNSNNGPCYFYAKGFCNKGDKCSFLHGPTDGNKSSKAASMVKNGVPCEKKLSAGSNPGSTPVESHLEQSETVQTEHTNTVKKHTQDSHQLASGSEQRSESRDISATDCEENFEFVLIKSDISNNQSSDQLIGGYVERERWLEPSPGFDNLVEDESERFGYEEDVDYFSDRNEEARELGPDEYDPVYPDLEYSLKENRYEVYDRLDDNQTQTRESIFYRLSFHKRKPIFNNRRNPDLRDHLKRRKLDFDLDHLISQNPQRHGSRVDFDFDHRHRLRKVDFDHEFGQNPQRLGSRVDFDFDHRISQNTRRVIRYRQARGKKRFGSWERREGMPAQHQKRNYWEESESSIFTGPKTLDQIKEEKKKGVINRDLGLFDRTESTGFRGPRPLSEILRNKRKFG